MDKDTLLYKRPFNTDPYLARLETNVTGCRPCEGGFAVTLERTIFFPRGGGQPCDGGYIDLLPVSDVYDEGGEILHILPRPFEPGQAVTLEIDLAARLRHMKHHLAQHIISACIHKLYGIDTVISRMEEGSCHIELTSSLTPEQLAAAEEYANGIIKADLPVTTDYYTPEIAKTFPVRGKITPHELIRLVTIGGFDISACGGTHCRSTGEIGEAVITGCKEVRDQFRIYYSAGLEAAEKRKKRLAQLLTLQNAFGCEDPEHGLNAALHAKEETRRLDAETHELRQRLLESDLRALSASSLLPDGSRFAAAFIESEDTKHYRAVCEAAAAGEKIPVMMAVAGGQSISLIFMRPKGDGPDFGKCLRELTSRFGGKGGGSPVSAQGMIPRLAEAEEEIRHMFKEFCGR